MEGKFAQVSGLNFTCDSRKEPGSRVLKVEMWDGSDLEPLQSYKLCLKHFIASGKDGYTCFENTEVRMLTDLENAKTLQGIIYSSIE